MGAEGRLKSNKDFEFSKFLIILRAAASRNWAQRTKKHIIIIFCSMVFPIMTFIEYHVNLIYPAEAELKRVSHKSDSPSHQK